MSDGPEAFSGGRLLDWGWSDDVEVALEPGSSLAPARVIAQHRGEYRLITPWVRPPAWPRDACSTALRAGASCRR